MNMKRLCKGIVLAFWAKEFWDFLAYTSMITLAVHVFYKKFGFDPSTCFFDTQWIIDNYSVLFIPAYLSGVATYERGER